MRILMGVQRIVSVRAVAPQNLIDKKSCERERCTMETRNKSQDVVTMYRVYSSNASVVLYA